MMTARYSFPPDEPITSSVVSPTHRWFGSSASKRRSRMLAGIGQSAFDRRPRFVALATPRYEISLLHQAHDPLLRDVDAQIEEIEVDPRRSVTSTAPIEGRLHEKAEPAVLDGMRGLRSHLPRIETASRDSKSPTPERHRYRLLCFDAREPHACIFAKKAVAFLEPRAPCGALGSPFGAEPAPHVLRGSSLSGPCSALPLRVAPTGPAPRPSDRARVPRSRQSWTRRGPGERPRP